MTNYYERKIEKYEKRLNNIIKQINSIDNTQQNSSELRENLNNRKINNEGVFKYNESKYNIFNNIEDKMDENQTCPICLCEFEDTVKVLHNVDILCVVLVLIDYLIMDVKHMKIVQCVEQQFIKIKYKY